MQNIKTNMIIIIGVVALSALIIWAYFSIFPQKTALVTCGPADRYNIMTGKQCPIKYEEVPSASTTIDLNNG